MAKSKRAATPASASDLPRLARPAQRALASAGITRLAQAAQRSDAELLALHGMGPNAVVTIRAALGANDVKPSRGKARR